MKEIIPPNQLLQRARTNAGLSQQALARRVGTSQSAIAKLEQGVTNPTFDTLERFAGACGFAVELKLVPLSAVDSVVDRYKQDVDRTLLRENLKKSIDERVRTLGEWQSASEALREATRVARNPK